MSRAKHKSRQKQRSTEQTAPDQSPAAPTESSGTPSFSTVEIKTRDVSNTPDLDSDQWPGKVWPVDAGPRGDGFQVVIKRSVLNAIHRHGHVNTEVEICGVMVGNVFRDDKGPYLLVDSIIRGDFAGSGNAQVTFTAETWNHIQRVMETEHPEAKIVGWYHTHPSFGIFLSDMDLFIHGNFFNMPWQVAFVYDPIGGDEGVFLWKDSKAERGSFVTLEDTEREVPTVQVSPEITAAALADFSRRTQRMERRYKMLVALVVFLVIVTVVYSVVLWWMLGDPRGQQAIRIVPQQPASRPAAMQESKPLAVVPSQPLATQPVLAVATTQPATAPSLAEIKALLRPATQPVVAATLPVVATTSATKTTKPAAPVFTPEIIRPKAETNGAKVLEAPSEAKQ